MSSPLVSVLMTAYNREAYIEQAIESVLSSTYKKFELIIVDDCSMDTTFEIAKKYEAVDIRIRAYKNDINLGDYNNRNKAASYAKGKYLKYLDSDDFMYSHCLEVMVNAMELFPEAGLGLSSVGDVAAPYPQCISSRQAYLEHFNGYGHFDRAPGSAIILKSAFDKIGGFSGKRWVGDIELWFHLSRNMSLVKFTRDLFWDRVHITQERLYEIDKSNVSKSKKMRDEILFEVLTHADCPLSKSEVEQILKNRRRKQFRDKLWGYVRKFI